MLFQKLDIALQRNKVLYYAANFLRQLVPPHFYQLSLKGKLSSIDRYDGDYIRKRVNYYNKLSGLTSIGNNSVRLNALRKVKGPKAYFFDTFEYARYFPQNLRANVLFMDVIHIPNVPTIQKSRPISGDNANAVLLNLDKKRHFLFVKDHKLFSEKKDMLIGRGAISQPHRIKFMEMYFASPLCDLGQVNRVGGDPDWIKPKMSIGQHLDYKFILSLEGNDVATNLKWIMSSNSVAVMPKPKYETWFMEGRLIPDFHYILIRDDYTDLEERLHDYIANPDRAERIVTNANEYVRQFFDKKREELISLLVLEKYFSNTNQIDQS